MERLWLASYVLAWVLTIALTLGLLSMIWIIGKIYLKTRGDYRALITEEGPELHRPMPDWQGIDTAGRSWCSSDFRGNELTLLFLSSNCAPCEAVLHAMYRVHRAWTYNLRYVIVFEGSDAETKRYQQQHRLAVTMISDEQGKIRHQIQVARIPYGFLIDEDGIVRMKGVVNNLDQLESLILRQGQYVGQLDWNPQQPLPEVPGVEAPS